MRHFYDFDEEWRPVVGVAHYEVSSLGAVRSVDRTILCADGRTRSFKGQLIRGTHDRRMGYHRVVLWDRSRAIPRTVHSLVAEAFIGPCPPGQEVRHLNGFPSDNRVVNLEYGTRTQNLFDASQHGTHPQGKKQECPRRHALVEPNLVKSTFVRGRRDCLSCARARAFIRTHPELSLEIEADRYYLRLIEGVK